MKMYKSGERNGFDVYISDTSLLPINYMSLADVRLPHESDDKPLVEADVTHLSNQMFVGKIADWLWDNCFNCWTFIERARQNALYQWYCDFFIRFDAESDAKKFQEFYNKGWSYNNKTTVKHMSDPNRENPLS